jgi:hypothetical protein
MIVVYYLINNERTISYQSWLDILLAILHWLRKRNRRPLQVCKSRTTQSLFRKNSSRRRSQTSHLPPARRVPPEDWSRIALPRLPQKSVFLSTLRAIVELTRGTIQASSSYIRNHQRVFDYPLNTLQYPVCQNTTIGYVRSLLDRQKIVDMVSNLNEETINFGQSRIQYNT